MKKKIVVSILVSVMVFMFVIRAEAGILDWMGPYDRNWERAYKQTTQNELIQKQGYNNDESINKIVHRAGNNLIYAINRKGEKIQYEYSVLVNKRQDMNAVTYPGGVIAIHEGLIKAVDNDEDMIAAVLAHEFRHAQSGHIIKTMNAGALISVAAETYIQTHDDLPGYITALVGLKNIMARGFGVPNEWEADKKGQEYLIEAGYNPAAMAALGQVFLEKNGDHKINFFGELLSPSDHPLWSKRIETQMKKVTEYSGGKVTTDAKCVYINGQKVVAPGAIGLKTGSQRAYLISGNVASAFAKSPKGGNFYVVEGSTQIKYNNYHIMSFDGSAEDAEFVAKCMNEALKR